MGTWYNSLISQTLLDRERTILGLRGTKRGSTRSSMSTFQNSVWWKEILESQIIIRIKSTSIRQETCSIDGTPASLKLINRITTCSASLSRSHLVDKGGLQIPVSQRLCEVRMHPWCLSQAVELTSNFNMLISMAHHRKNLLRKTLWHQSSLCMLAQEKGNSKGLSKRTTK